MEGKTEIRAPNGGWGYITAVTLVIVLMTTIMPMISMGLIFGDFITRIGYNTTDLVLISIITLSASHLIGIVSMPLLNLYSVRVVSLIGALLVIFGNFLTVSVRGFWDLVLYYGIIHAFGIGILLPAHFASLQSYFDTRLTMVVSTVYVFCTFLSLLYPSIVVVLLETCGFRSTLLILAGISACSIITSLLLKPIESKNNETQLLITKPEMKSIRAILSKLFDLQLFINPIYLNVSIGLSVAFIADVGFFTMIPLLLQKKGFTLSQVGFLLTIALIGELATTIVLSLLNVVFKIRNVNRTLFFIGTLTAIVFRSVFVYETEYKWKIVSLVVLGSTKALNHTVMPGIISEKFPDKFGTAYSLFRIVCGLTTVCLGLVLYFIKSLASDEVYLVQLLNTANGICGLGWVIEFVIKKLQ